MLTDGIFLNSIFTSWNNKCYSSKSVWLGFMNTSLYHIAAEFSVLINEIFFFSGPLWWSAQFQQCFLCLVSWHRVSSSCMLHPPMISCCCPFIRSSAWHFVYQWTGGFETLEADLEDSTEVCQMVGGLAVWVKMTLGQWVQSCTATLLNNF